MFGPTGAVYGWHRFGSLMRCLLRRFFNVLASRYVDDFFGVDRANTRITGKEVLHIASKLVGVPCDEGKGMDRTREMVILGMLVAFHPERQTLTVTVDALKTYKWVSQLLDILKQVSS